MQQQHQGMMAAWNFSVLIRSFYVDTLSLKQRKVHTILLATTLTIEEEADQYLLFAGAMPTTTTDSEYE